MKESPAPLLLVHLLLLLLSPLLQIIVLDGGSSDLRADREALVAFRSRFPMLRHLWNVSVPHCSWTGVACKNDRAVKLHLPASNLAGPIPPRTIGKLTELRVLSLRYNALTGSLPSDIVGPKKLQHLVLKGNKLSGQIPPSLSSLQKLRTLDFASNLFSGPIPDLDLPHLQMLDLSENALVGSIPPRLRKWSSSGFAGMPLVCGIPASPCLGEVAPPPPPLPATEPLSRSTPGKHKLPHGWFIGIIVSVGALLLVFFVLVILILVKRLRSRSKIQTAPVNLDSVEVHAVQETILLPGNWEWQHLGPWWSWSEFLSTMHQFLFRPKLVFLDEDATKFNLACLRSGVREENAISGMPMFKVALENGTAVTVGQIKNRKWKKGEFAEKMKALGAIAHENVVPLMAYCYSKHQQLLLYKYSAQPSLHTLLHGGQQAQHLLDWESRYAIALAAAKGVACIHSTGPLSIHGNIRSSNILIGQPSTAYVSEIGLLPLLPDSITEFAGYEAPELQQPLGTVLYAENMPQQRDVYSFGVLLLEILTGKAPRSPLLEVDNLDLVSWIQLEGIDNVFDPNLATNEESESQKRHLLSLAMECTSLNPHRRPSMCEIRELLEEYQSG